jgi:hypothetical protein
MGIASFFDGLQGGIQGGVVRVGMRSGIAASIHQTRAAGQSCGGLPGGP